MTGGYTTAVNFMLKRVMRVSIFVGVLFFSAGWLTSNVPTAFLPEEDLGYLIVYIQLPVA